MKRTPTSTKNSMNGKRTSSQDIPEYPALYKIKNPSPEKDVQKLSNKYSQSVRHLTRVISHAVSVYVAHVLDTSKDNYKHRENKIKVCWSA